MSLGAYIFSLYVLIIKKHSIIQVEYAWKTTHLEQHKLIQPSPNFKVVKCLWSLRSFIASDEI